MAMWVVGSKPKRQTRTSTATSGGSLGTAAESEYAKQIKQLQDQLAKKDQLLQAKNQNITGLRDITTQASAEMADLEKRYAADKQSMSAAQTENESQLKTAIADLEAQSQAGVTSLEALQSQYDAVVQKFQEREAEYKPLVDQLGANAGQEADAERAKMMARAKQLMVSRGMSETSAMQTAEREIAGASEQARSQLEGQLAQEKVGYLNSLSGDTLALREGAAAMQQGVANQAFQFRQAPISAKQSYADILGSQNAARAGLESGYGALKETQRGFGQTLSAQGYAFNKGQELAMNQAKTESKLGYAGITANELMSDATRRVNAPTYSHVIDKNNMYKPMGYSVRTS